ncbi:MAG: SAM-dependent DNA methyltransferase [Ignavibacteria bacterium]|nr:SAM-dependent DNA methyltransferase [Ignavibacteria bacterium]
MNSLNEDKNNDNQVKSKHRVANYGEVFTAEREVNAMLDLVKGETERIDSRFLEPACGTGNFLVEILKRKLTVVENRYSKNQLEYERYAIIAVSSVYGIEKQFDNVIECRNRLYDFFNQKYISNFNNSTKDTVRKIITYLLEKNIIWGDALTFKNPETEEPIILAEWVFKSNDVERKDYIFQFLVEKESQLTFFNENNEPQNFDKKIKDYPLTHFLKLSEL